MSDAATHAASTAMAQAPTTEGAFDVSELINHHITDGNSIEVPGTHLTIPLPRIHIGGIDFSITRHVVMMWIACLLLLLFCVLAARRIKDPVPKGWRTVFEVFIKYIRDEIARKAIGHEGDRYLPYLLTCFFFIWTCNLLGLIPGLSTPTSNISVTAALAVLAFFMIHLAGIRRYGVVKHLKHVMPGGLPAWLYPIMLPVEILGMFTKPFALCIRLFANMTAGHVMVLALISIIFTFGSVLIGIAPVAMAVGIMILELFVALLQAYVFTLLVSSFIGQI